MYIIRSLVKWLQNKGTILFILVHCSIDVNEKSVMSNYANFCFTILSNDVFIRHKRMTRRNVEPKWQGN